MRPRLYLHGPTRTTNMLIVLRLTTATTADAASTRREHLYTARAVARHTVATRAARPLSIPSPQPPSHSSLSGAPQAKVFVIRCLLNRQSLGENTFSARLWRPYSLIFLSRFARIPLFSLPVEPVLNNFCHLRRAIFVHFPLRDRFSEVPSFKLN